VLNRLCKKSDKQNPIALLLFQLDIVSRSILHLSSTITDLKDEENKLASIENFADLINMLERQKTFEVLKISYTQVEQTVKVIMRLNNNSPALG
jgi:PDZ domain-containing secreted protein